MEVLRLRILLLACCMGGLGLPAASGGGTRADGLRILPVALTLTGAEARHRLLVVRRVNGENAGELDADKAEVRFVVSDPAVVSVEDGVVIPRANGTTDVAVTVGGETVTSRVTVRGMERPHGWSFRNHVQSVLTRAGCNSGACHGALAGKGGFKLSLRGYDTPTDFHAISHQARGRRIELSDPGRSMVLAKPSGGLPHKGGLRFEVGSRDYRVLAEWIASGAAPPRNDDAMLEGISVLPAASVLRPGDGQQLLVQATYSDGSTSDVTEWAKFTSASDAVATVDEHGRVAVVGPGEGAVTAWFGSRIVTARVTVPWEYDVAPETYAAAPRRNFIDELVLKQLQRLKLEPSPPATDSAFVRRAFLDTIGTLPTADEVRSFLADESPDKRDALIEQLLERPEFVDYWTYRWSDVLLINGTRLRPKAVAAYYKWVRGHVEANTGWDDFVTDLVTAQGSSHENGATNFYALHQSPEDMAENVSQAFLGLSIGCARCHNHPLEKWTNNQYYSFANLFSRVRAKGWGGDGRSGDGLRTLFVVAEGDLIQPASGRPQPPAPLDAEPLAFDETTDRRVHLARWLTAPENPYFARAITNRVWANYFGVGLVEQVDDLRASNPASNEELLAEAAEFLVAADFDLKSLMRVILQSSTYQRSSVPLPQNREEGRFYSRYYPRRLMAEVLLDAISQVTGVSTKFSEIDFPGADRQKTDFYKEGTRALQLYDSAVSSYFLKTFGRNQRRITCECERSDEPSMVQVLHISNGDTLNQKLSAADNRVKELLASGESTEAIIEAVFLAALARPPVERERRELSRFLDEASAEQRRVVLEDVFWSVMSSREFLFNH